MHESGRDSGSHLARHRTRVLGVALAAVLLTGAGVLASTVIKSPAQAAAEAGPPPEDVLTAPVERRVLRDTVVMRGTVTAAQSADVGTGGGTAEGTAKPVVTKEPLQAGDAVQRGRVLLEVSGRPVFALKGRLPVYRDLKPGAKGADVIQLQTELRALGHGTGADASGVFGAGTKSALNAFYGSIGYDPLPAQADGGKAVQSAKDAVTAAERTVEDAQSGSDGTKGGETTGTSASAGTVGGGGRTERRAREDLARARAELAKAEAADGPMLPASEVLFLRDFPARVDTVRAKVGSEVSGPVLTVSAGKLVVHGYLEEYQKGMVRPGSTVEITSETSQVSVSGKVTSVASDMTTAAPQQQEGDQSAAAAAAADGTNGYLMVVEPDKALPAVLAGQDVRLTIEAASTSGKALILPVTAVSAGADGKSVVTVVEPGGRQRRVEVRPGTTGDGYVEVTPVSGGRLAEGDKVVTGVREQGTR
ncbi:peptidoglycan-binding protein [Streptomyces ossamyceticus]|nr:peptidoglycan-binding protein [Streptomyces ossamyceticus]